jgi:hypothetical protein
MSGLPADIANQALDAIGSEVVLGDIEDGSREAQVLLRAYGETIRQLLRSANWNFATKIEAMTLLADASGATPNVGTIVPMNALYEYSYPTDCLRARSVRYQPGYSGVGTPAGNIGTSGAPLTTGQLTTSYGNPMRRAKFCLINDPNYPVAPGQQWWDVPGLSPTGRLVVLTNAPNAQMIYTMFNPYPSMWDSLFREAIVAILAAKVALPLTKDKRAGMALRREQMIIAKEAIMQARIADGNEQPMSNDIPVDWMRERMSGGMRGAYGRGGWVDFDGYFTMPFDGNFA